MQGIRASPGQIAALGKILPSAPCLTLVNINELELKMNNTFVQHYLLFLLELVIDN